jgi:aminoglycoside phosphotransferase (APT) family kinase protein
VTPERRRLVEAALGRPTRRVVEIDDGYDYEVAIVDDAWVFRFPRRAGVAEALEVEIALLPALAPELPVAVPRFERVVREPELFAAYRLIDGAPSAQPPRRSVGAFLSALHAFDVAGAEARGVERPAWAEHYGRQCAEFERLVFPAVDPAERAAARRMFAAGVASLHGFEPALLHADLGPDHLLCRDGSLVGVIDWGDVRIGDPALDFAWALSALGEAVLAAYDRPIDDGFRGRALFYHRLGPWYEAHNGLFTGRRDRVERGLRGIRERLYVSR